MSWCAEAEQWITEHRGNVAEVVMLLRRDEGGIDYEVLLRLESVPGAEVEADWQIGPLWERRVMFDRTHIAAARGPAFEEAAREQEQVAAETWEKTR
jgi:hypothetical protein